LDELCALSYSTRWPEARRQLNEAPVVVDRGRILEVFDLATSMAPPARFSLRGGARDVVERVAALFPLP